MEVFLLVFQIRNFRIDGDDCIRELEHISQCIDKLVVADRYIMTGSGLEPTVTIAAQQDSRTGSMIKDILFHNRFLWCAEQRTAGTVITDHIVGKINFGRPLQILDAKNSGFADGRVDRLGESDFKLFGSVCRRPIDGLDGSNLIGITQDLHCLGVDELHSVARKSPFKTVTLRMHIFTDQRLIVYPLLHFQISAVHVDRVVHHSFVQAADRNDLSFTTGKMGGIRLCRKITGITVATKADREFIQRDILTHLGQ